MMSSKQGPIQHRNEGVQLTAEQDQFLLPHFFALIVGKPGSGKSHLVKQLVTEPQYYGRKFDVVLIISPSAQKLGIPVAKEARNTSYDLEWIYDHINKINQSQIKRFQQILKSRNALGKAKSIVPFVPQSVIETSFSQDKAHARPNAPSSKLPNEYLQFNKNQRFFTVEILAVMNQGFGKVDMYGQTNGPPLLQKSDQVITKGKKRISKEESKQKMKKALFDAPTTYKDVDDIEQQLVSKLDPQEVNKCHVNVLIVLDDVISDVKANENNSAQSQLFFNRRHLIADGTISIFLLSQKYTMIPARLRSQANWMILFRLNPVDFDTVYKDVIMLNPKQWEQILEEVYQTSKDNENHKLSTKRYDHLDIMVEYDLFFKNFQKLTLPSNTNFKS